MVTERAGMNSGLDMSWFVTDTAQFNRPIRISPHTMNNTYRCTRQLLASLLLTFALPLGAQTMTSEANPEAVRTKELARRVEVRVALVDKLPIESSAPLISRQGSQGDFILMDRASMSREGLARAVYHLALLRDIQGDTARLAGNIRVPASKGADRMLAREGKVIDGMLARIESADVKQLAVGGSGRAISVYLPSKAMKEELNISVARTVRR